MWITFSAIDASVQAPLYGRGLLFTGMTLMAVGLLFKIGAVPFHNWVPDVYVGSPTPVTGFMAICTKLAAVLATVRFFFVALGAERIYDLVEMASSVGTAGVLVVTLAALYAPRLDRRAALGALLVGLVTTPLARWFGKD